MNQDDRRRAITSLVTAEGSKSAEELALYFQVTVQTIRADIRFLTEKGLLFRTHGGVAAFERENVGYQFRELHNREGKKRISHRVHPFLEGASNCFLGTGTTVEMVAHAIPKQTDIDVFTNNLHAATALCEHPKVTITLAGGALRKRDKDIIGGDAIRFYSRYRAQFGIVSVGGIDQAGNLYDYTDSEVMAREALCSHAKVNILVVDSSKFGVEASCQNGTISDFDIVVADFAPTEEIEKRLTSSKTQWVTA